MILMVGIGHLIGSHLVKKYLKIEKSKGQNNYLVIYNLVFGLGVVGYMFQAGIIFWLILITANYFLAKLCRSYFFYEPLL